MSGGKPDLKVTALISWPCQLASQTTFLVFRSHNVQIDLRQLEILSMPTAGSDHDLQVALASLAGRSNEWSLHDDRELMGLLDTMSSSLTTSIARLSGELEELDKKVDSVATAVASADNSFALLAHRKSIEQARAWSPASALLSQVWNNKLD